MYRFSPFLLCCLIACLACAATLARAADDPLADTVIAPEAERKRLWDEYGIAPTSLRADSEGYAVTFRYRVVDSGKAAVLSHRKDKAALIHEASGAELAVAESPKIGKLRQTTRLMKEGAIYSITFDNKGRLVKPGDRVTITVGAFTARGLTVQR